MDIRILMLEDVATDAELIERQLKKAGITFVALRVDNREAFVRALDAFEPDIVLSDYRLPDFDGRAALEIVMNSHPSIPVVLVSGMLGEEAAVELLKAGATDYVLKDRLVRLGSAVQRALAAAREARLRRQAEQALAHSEMKFRALVETSSDWIWETGRDGTYTYASPRAKELLGYAPEELIGKSPFDFMPAAEAARAATLFAARAAARLPVSLLENVNLRKDGRRVVIETSGTPILGAGGELLGYRGVDRDITQRKEDEAKIHHLDRLIRSSRSINRLIVREKDRDRLLQAACDNLVEQAGYRLAWIGEYRIEQERLVPLAQAGFADGYLEAVRIAWDDTESGQGRAHAVIQDIASDPRYAPWREAALARGYRACGSFRLLYHGKRYGTLNVYLDKPDAFDAEELALLDEVADDIAYAQHGIEVEGERRRNEDDLRQTRNELEAVLDNAMIGIAHIRGRVILRANRKLAEMLAWTKEELVGQSTAVFYPSPEAFTTLGREAYPLLAQGHVYSVEREFKRKDGTLLWVYLQGRLLDPADPGGASIWVFDDVTDRRRADAERLESAERLKRSLEETIRAVASTVEMRDPYTAGHQLRVAELAVAIAEEMGLDRDRTHGLHLAGTVHDLGKIHIPAEILSKPGRLSALEFSLIKTHPQAGYDILKDVEFPWPIAQIVLQHHERQDGSGYPNGLKDEQILPEAKILAVADVVEAMASHRPYRPSLGLETALEEILRQRGGQLDAQAVDACVALIRQRRFAFVG